MYFQFCVWGRVQTMWTNEGERVAHRTTILKQLFGKSVLMGDGVKIPQNSVHVVCTRPRPLTTCVMYGLMYVIVCVRYASLKIIQYQVYKITITQI